MSDNNNNNNHNFIVSSRLQRWLSEITTALKNIDNKLNQLEITGTTTTAANNNKQIQQILKFKIDYDDFL